MFGAWLHSVMDATFGVTFDATAYIAVLESIKITVRLIKSRSLRWTGHVARMKEGRSAFKILTEKRHLGRPRRRWEDNIRMDLEGRGVNAGNCVDSVQDRNFGETL